jgi:hypothetical protein
MNEGKMKEEPNGEILVYQNDDGSLELDVRLQGETVWLNQLQLVELYQSSKANVSEHIKNIFEEGELTKETTVRNFRTVQIEGSRQVTRNVECYNLDMIISLGYRIKSSVATKFRQWARIIVYLASASICMRVMNEYYHDINGVVMRNHVKWIRPELVAHEQRQCFCGKHLRDYERG